MSESPAPSTTEVVDPRYQYLDIAPPQLPVSMLDGMMQAIIDPEPVKKIGIWGLIVNLVRMGVILAWLVAREKLIKQQQDLTKQKYERDQAGKNQADIDKDDLSGERKPK